MNWVVGTICGEARTQQRLTRTRRWARLRLLVEKTRPAIFEETGELIGMEH